MAYDSTFYSHMFAELNTTLFSYVSNTAQGVIEYIKPVSKTLVAIYICFWGWAMMRGAISEPIMDGVNRIVRLSIIIGIALTLGTYNNLVSSFLWALPDLLADQISGGNATTTTSFLDTLMGQMYDFGLAFYNKSYANSTLGIPSLGLFFAAWAIWIAGILATGYGAFLLALSKIGLAIALGIGPIFILLTMFETTKKFFDAWIGQVLNYVFTVLLTACAIKVILTILQHYLTDSSVTVAADPSINNAIPAVVFALIGTLVLIQMPSMASALGGGVTLGTLGAVGWAYGKSKGTASALLPSNLKRSYNKVRANAQIMGSAAKAVGGAPRAVYRKISGSTRN